MFKILAKLVGKEEIKDKKVNKTSLTSISSIDFKQYTDTIVDTIDDVSDYEKFINIDYMTRKIFNYIYLRGEIVDKFTMVLNPIVQHTEQPLSIALLFLRALRTNMVIDVCKYQRENLDPEFPLIAYLQILNSLMRLNHDAPVIIPELIEIYNRPGTTLKEKMCIADIVLNFNSALGEQMLEEIRMIEERLRIEREVRAPQTQQGYMQRTIYDDSQNVHNAGINSSVNNIIRELCSNHDAVDAFKIIKKKIKVNHRIKETLERIQFDSARFGGYTLKDIFNALVGLIVIHPQCDDMLVRLREELLEMAGYCSTGHAARLVNVLQGFDVDEALVLEMDCIDEMYSIFNKVMCEYLLEYEDIMDLMLEDIHIFTKHIIEHVLPDFEKNHMVDYDLPDYQQRDYKIKILVKYTKLKKNVISSMI